MQHRITNGNHTRPLTTFEDNTQRERQRRYITEVHRNVAIFELIRAFDYILHVLSASVSSDLKALYKSVIIIIIIAPTEISWWCLKGFKRIVLTNTQTHIQTLLKTIPPSLRCRCTGGNRSTRCTTTDRQVFLFSHLTYFVHLLYLGKLSRPKYQ